MNIMLNFMDKIYSDTKTLKMVYIVGAVLLFIFIILLIFSLRKNDDKKDDKKIVKVDEDKHDDVISETKDSNIVDEKDSSILNESDNKTEAVDEVEESKENEPKEEDSNIFEKTTIIPLENVTSDKQELSKEENISKALDNVESMKTLKTEEKKDNTDYKSLSDQIPDVDDFVNDVVKKTYEKNEQFSSVYVGDNTSTMKLDKVMDEVNLDNDVKKELTGVDDVSDNKKIEEDNTLDVNLEDNTSTASELVTHEIPTKLDNLKEALEEKKKEEKVETTAINKEDLLNKLNALKK